MCREPVLVFHDNAGKVARVKLLRWGSTFRLIYGQTARFKKFKIRAKSAPIDIVSSSPWLKYRQRVGIVGTRSYHRVAGTKAGCSSI
jgi:hypothetical protein